MTIIFFALNARMLRQELIILPFTLNEDREVTGNLFADFSYFATAEYYFYCYLLCVQSCWAYLQFISNNVCKPMILHKYFDPMRR